MDVVYVLDHYKNDEFVGVILFKEKENMLPYLQKYTKELNENYFTTAKLTIETERANFQIDEHYSDPWNEYTITHRFLIRTKRVH